MPDMILRLALPGEAGDVRELVRRSYAKWVPVIGREPMPMQTDYAAAIEDHLVYVLDAGTGIAAICELAQKPDHLFIVNLAVTPEMQGHGVGRHLLEFAEDIARQRGYAEVRLLTNEKMDFNRAFYRRHGFVEFDHVPFPAGGVTVHMRKVVGSKSA